MSMKIGEHPGVHTPHEVNPHQPAAKPQASPKPADAHGVPHAPARAQDGFEIGHAVLAHFHEHVDAHAKGAYFRKVESPAASHNQGIHGTGTLPQVHLDPQRMFQGQGETAWQTGPLERPSVYMGGRSAGHEVDCGLTFDRVYDTTGKPTFTDNPSGSDMRDPEHRFTRGSHNGQPTLVNGKDEIVAQGKAAVEEKLRGLKENFAFRPYWRDSNSDTPKDKHWHNPDVGTKDNVYFYPGERFTMSVKSSGPDKIRMDIRLEDSKTYQHFTTHFRQEGFGSGQASSFKRVNSVDQFVVRDGKRVGAETTGQVEPTRTAALGASWDRVAILHTNGRDEPMTGPNFSVVKGADIAQRYGEIFGLSGNNDQGGERIDIHPAGR